MKKTYKRELAILLLVWLVYLVETKDINIVEVTIWPIFSFVTAAFGFDAYGKLQQGSTKPPHRGRTERGSERTGRENQLPDDWDNK
jgi:hypothetical protein